MLLVKSNTTTSFNLDDDLEECETSIGNQKMRLRNFDESLGLYYQEVKEIESNVLSQFVKISGKSEDISTTPNSWAVCDNGERSITLSDMDYVDLTDRNIQAQVTDGSAVTVSDNPEDAKTLTMSEVISGVEKYVSDKGSEYLSNVEEELEEIEQVANDIKEYDWNNFITNLNDKASKLNKAPALTATIADYKNITKKNIWEDFFMPTTGINLNATSAAKEGSMLKNIGYGGSAAGLISTVINPIVEYNNSLQPYHDDLEVCAKIDPDNYNRYWWQTHLAAGVDDISFGYVRGGLTTPSTVYEWLRTPNEYSQGWTKMVDEWINSRNLVEKADKAMEDPVIGPKIKAFLK